MPTAQKTAMKLRNISITNYKGIDEIKLEFPAPRMPDATDIMVLGSRNGLGKTSILECCCLLLIAPELHLNAQWHRSFINCLVKLAPNNQYIMATHSEDIMDSVDENRRLLLVGSNGGNQ